MSNYSTTVVDCKNSKKCTPISQEFSYYSGNHLCARGYIGARCESCDIRAEFWDDNYAKTSRHECSTCDDLTNNFIIIVVFMFLYLIMITGVISSQ